MSPHARPHLAPLSLLAAVCSACWVVGQAPAIEVDPLYADGAVLQRDAEVAIRGRAAPGDTVRLTSEAVPEALAVADRDGRFAVALPPQPATGPLAYTLTSRRGGVTVRDVYFGDVYLASGQSNMEWPLDDTDDAARALAVDDPLLRHLKVPKVPRERPASSLSAEAAWVSAAPGRSAAFSAVAFYFAEALRARDPEVAIGLVNSSWGGSRIEAWLPAERTGEVGSLEVPAEVRANWRRLLDAYPAAFEPGGDDQRPEGTGGVPTPVGRKWEWAGYDGIDGEIYFDRVVELDGERAGGPAVLVLGAVDDSDSTWVNGTFVGATEQAYAKTRRYELPAGVLRAGENRVTVWVDDTGGGGGLYQSPDSLYLLAGGERLALGEGWTSRPKRLVLDSLRQPQQAPTLLYNGMLHPLAGMKASAALWYQGESNAGDLAEALAYGDQLRDLVAVFRETTGQPALPVLVVELPEWQAPSAEAYEANATWPEIRRQQRSLSAEPGVTSVVTLGLGDPDDIHPRNKRPVGERLAEAARRLVYGDDDAARQARLTGADLVGGGAVLRFDGVGDGLALSGGAAVRGLAVRDASGRWRAAEGEIVAADRIRVATPEGAGEIRAVAYAWANTPVGVNLVNGFGWPVSSFRFAFDE